MDDEYFYGATLEKEAASVTWNFNENDEEQQGQNCKLLIKQILLGHTAKEDELNVVQVETMSMNEHLKIPIAVLKAGENRCITTNFEFPDPPVVFRLIKGNGPVYIHGNQTPIFMEHMDEEAEDDEAQDEEEVALEEEEEGPQSKKKKVAENGSKAAPNGNKASIPKSNKRPHKP